jgi:putative ABC transport system permease protein
LSGNISSHPVQIDGVPALGQGDSRPWVEVFSASEDYLRTMGIQSVRGRRFTRHDAEAGFRAVLVNESAARQFWPYSRAIGQHLSLQGIDAAGSWREVVGIVKDTSDLGLDQTAKSALYVPMEQGVEPPQFLAVRTADMSAAFVSALRQAVASVDREQPILTVTPMHQLVESSIGARRFAMRVLVAFGLMSLLLAGVGLYGVVSYSVARRSPEIGLRLALGASRAGIFHLVLKQSMGLTVIGLGAGALGAFLSMRWNSSLLYGVSAGDPLTGVAACAAIGLVALIASYLPARQATLVDPVTALRQD